MFRHLLSPPCPACLLSYRLCGSSFVPVILHDYLGYPVDNLFSLLFRFHHVIIMYADCTVLIFYCFYYWHFITPLQFMILWLYLFLCNIDDIPSIFQNHNYSEIQHIRLFTWEQPIYLIWRLHIQQITPSIKIKFATTAVFLPLCCR